MEKRFAKDPHLSNHHSKTIKEVFSKCYVIYVHSLSFQIAAYADDIFLTIPCWTQLNLVKWSVSLTVRLKFYGTSMNKSLLVGPDPQQNLVFVLLRFRQNLFCRIGWHWRDVPTSRVSSKGLTFPSFVFWGGRPTADVVVHQYTRNIFVPRDSPMCARYALQRTALDNQAMYPDATSDVFFRYTTT